MGRWCKAPCHRTRGLVARQSKVRDDVIKFAKEIKPVSLYAAAGDPKNLERGGRPYWLFRTGASKAFKSNSKLRAFGHPNAPIIKPKTWVVRGQWYLSTADDPNQRLQKYKLLPDYHYITVSSVIQEHGLEFQHEGRSRSAAESTLHGDSHDRIMAHNFASYR